VEKWWEMKMAVSIIYPRPLRKGSRIAVTAPSSGVEEHLHFLLHKAKQQVESHGFEVVEGETIWTEDKCVSSPKEKRVNELMRFLLDDTVDAIIPPWGGQFLIDILPLIDWERLKQSRPTWILGYSDTSTLLFTYTVRTRIATAHGPNYCEMSAPYWDETSKRWIDVLALQKGGQIIQDSSEMYQSSWEKVFQHPGTGFYFDTPTEWKTLGRKQVTATGRLIGGCLETLSSLSGTPYVPIQEFARECKEDGMLWYLESGESTAAEIYRRLWTLKENGWFVGISGLIFGRPGGYRKVKNFELIDALEAIFGPMEIPVIWDADVGHVPPQMTLVNGALTEVKAEKGKGIVKMRFD
jgi:muramoyltetrapeptide carboxypeptidase